MEQLKLGTILQLAKQLKDEGLTPKQIRELPVYIGADDELNGIHTAWYGQMIDPKNKDDRPFIDLIHSDRGNLPIQGKAILIS